MTPRLPSLFRRMPPKSSKNQQSPTSENKTPVPSSETPTQSNWFKMKIALLALVVPLLGFVVAKEIQVPFLNSSGWTIHQIPPENRIYWMQQAMHALYNYSGPCPQWPFGTVIVNHTASGDELVCVGANNFTNTGDPTQHGEVNAIQRCVRVLAERGLNATEIRASFRQLSLYTNAEPCPMCASAIRYAGFKEYIYGTSIDHLVKSGWSQILISSQEVQAQSWLYGTGVKVIGSVGTEFTNPLYEWQYQDYKPCPAGCGRVNVTGGVSTCVPK